MKFLWSKIHHNFLLKVASLFFALLLWIYVGAEADPVRSRTFSGIPVEIAGMNSLEQNQLAIRGETSRIFSEVRVTVGVPMSELSDLSESQIMVTADLSQVQAEGQYAITLEAHSSIGEAVRVTPRVVTIVVEKRVTVELPVQVSFVGELGDGLFGGTPVVSPQSISVTGAESDIASIKRAVVSPVVTEVSSLYQETLPVELRGENGEVISYLRFSNEEPRADVTFPVYPVRTLPISPSVPILDFLSLPDGVFIASIEVTPSTLAVAGEDIAFAGINQLQVNGVTIGGASGSLIEIPSTVILPDGMFAPDGNQVTVRITLRQGEE